MERTTSASWLEAPGTARAATHTASSGRLPAAAFAIALAGVSCWPAVTQAARLPERQVVTAALTEVQRGTVDGREFLTLFIGGLAVGPRACHGTVLRVDTAQLGDMPRRERIETVALSAMLNDEAVSITVPLDEMRCIDGKPTFTDLRRLPVAP